MSKLTEQLEKQLKRAYNSTIKAVELIETHYTEEILPLTNDTSPTNLRDARHWFLGATGRLRSLANEMRCETPFLGSTILKMVNEIDTQLAKKEKPPK